MKEKRVCGTQIEELLRLLRLNKNWTYLQVLEKINDDKLTEKDIKKWEYGLKYPDLDTIYKLSELYQISSEELIQAKNNSYEQGMGSININTIKWICYFLNISLSAGAVLTVIFYVAALIGALLFFLDMASRVKRQ